MVGPGSWVVGVDIGEAIVVDMFVDQRVLEAGVAGVAGADGSAG